MSRYKLTFEFIETKEKADRFCAVYNSQRNHYMKQKGYDAHYVPWQSLDGKENLFCVLYYEKW